MLFVAQQTSWGGEDPQDKYRELKAVSVSIGLGSRVSALRVSHLQNLNWNLTVVEGISELLTADSNARYKYSII